MKLSHMNRLSALLADEYGFPAEVIAPVTELAAIGLTSLDHYRLAALVEDAFAIDLPYHVEVDWRTVGDVLDAVAGAPPAASLAGKVAAWARGPETVHCTDDHDHAAVEREAGKCRTALGPAMIYLLSEVRPRVRNGEEVAALAGGTIFALVEARFGYARFVTAADAQAMMDHLHDTLDLAFVAVMKAGAAGHG